ncbi:MAG: hypothetical protein ACI8QF_000905 [Limisphaerales bacterium]|jgi:hypothetical protein
MTGEGMGRVAIQASTFPPKKPSESVPFIGGLVEKNGILELVLVPQSNKGSISLRLYQDKLTGKGTDGGKYEFKIQK